MKKILVTGGGGWIGGEFIKQMKNVECISYDLPDKDILDYTELEMWIDQCDLVVHFAAVADLYQSIDNQYKNFSVNIEGTYNIAEICADMKKKLVFISTCCVYGNSGDKVETEDKTIPACTEPYATSKMAGEYILRGTPNLEYIILRIGTAYGPGQRDSLFTAVALDNILGNTKIGIHGSGEQTRQLIYIDDLVSGIVKAVDNMGKLNNREIINLCSEEHISPMDTIRTVENITGKAAKYEFVPDRYGQTYIENCSIDKAKRLLKWTPKNTFEEGMKKTYALDKRYS